VWGVHARQQHVDNENVWREIQDSGTQPLNRIVFANRVLPLFKGHAVT